MTPDKNPALQMLATALEMEERGRTFYEGAVATCSNELGKDIFRLLMKDEILHVGRIRKIYDSLVKNRVWTEEWKSLQPDHKDLKALFREVATKHGPKIQAETSDVEAVEVGIGFEAKTVAFYEGRLAGAADPLEKAFLDQMVVEERSHHAALAMMKLYFTDPSSYFLESERGGLDGA